MFDISADDIAQLDDTNLRALVGRLCEAELVSRGHSPAAVTWGGNQTAADGGVDVRVTLPGGASIDGFIPRRSTGFQVKTPDMPRAAILDEMRPEGVLRPVIQALADEGGAYIIVSSHGSTSDTALDNRRNAMREALSGAANADQLCTDFYDRTRLATWVRQHPGLITWVKRQIGRTLVGWRPYGPWSGGEGTDAEYLLDDKLRVDLGERDAPARSTIQAIESLRNELTQPGTIVRLVGLSGVGKTRFVEALFDARIGTNPVAPSLAVYTNLSDGPDPQPTGLASDLLANHTRAVLIVDNCPPDLHRRLFELCSRPNSTVSVITIEYDVRDDQPEGTQVVSVDTSSPELIERLIRRRYQHLSQVDARTIAEVSGGNSRIAIAIADTVEHTETIAGLSDDALFERLFRQRQDPDNGLLRAAQACSLVYSFEGEELTGEHAELPRLATLAGQGSAETFRHVSELLRRNLAQQRGAWRAVLPHAIANRLAKRALQDTPYGLIDEHLVRGTDRLARSFSRRLSFLHDEPRAVAIVDRWLQPQGLLGDAGAFTELRRAMFENVAPVSPTGALGVLERAGDSQSHVAATIWMRHRALLRSLAYDPQLFERSVRMLSETAIRSEDEQAAKQSAETFTSLFHILLSGTHATLEQRLVAVERLVRSADERERTLGLAALDAVLEARHFSSHHGFEFGARSRDYGYRPNTNDDVDRWYSTAVMFIEHLAFGNDALKPQLRDLFAQNFRALWTSTGIHDALENLCRRFADGAFWREGWAACRETLHFNRDDLPADIAARLAALEADLRPSNLLERVRAVVLGNRSSGLDVEDLDPEPATAERMDTLARTLGEAVAADDEVFDALVPDLARGGNRAFAFGRGLARAAPDRRAAWERVVQGLEAIPTQDRNVQVLRGFLAELCESDRDLADQLLDSSLDQPALLAFVPLLHSAVVIDRRGIERLKRALHGGQIPVAMFQYLAYGSAPDHIPGADLKELLLLIADVPNGFEVALEILYMRLLSERQGRRDHDRDVLEVGRELLPRVTFRRGNHRIDHQLAEVVNACLQGPEASVLAAELAVRLRDAIATHVTTPFDNDDLLAALLRLHPKAVLDAIFDQEDEQRRGLRVFERLGQHGRNPADGIPNDALMAWCDADASRRYPLAAGIITFAHRAVADGPLVWTGQATAVISRAPDPRAVLAVFVDRFEPMTWSGSRATLMEANGALLDALEPLVPTGVMPFVNQAKVQLMETVTREREVETRQDQVRDQRFEE